jgi:1-acyl-sn-glycerol-3-phosphate acyltransferase
MRKLFLGIYDWLSGRKTVAVLLATFIMLLSVISALRMDYEEDIARFLPLDNRDTRQTELMDRLQEQNRIAVIFRYDGSDDVESALADAMDRFEELWFDYDTLGLVPDMSALADESMAMELIEFVQEHTASFLTDADYRRMDSLLSQPGYVDSQLEADRRSLQMLTGGFTKNLIPNDPLNLFSPLLIRLSEIGGNTGFRVSEDGYMMHSTLPVGVLFFDSPYGQSESDHNADLVALVERVGAQVTSETGIAVSQIGAPVIAVSNAERIKKDSILAVALAVIGILIVLWFSFRRIGDMLWLVITLLFGGVFALGLTGLFKDSISIIVIGLGSVLVGIAANYPLHFLHSLHDTADNRRSLGDMVVPLLTGNITTVSAFFCLIFLKAEAMHDLALFGSFMLVGTILFTLVFLPVFVKPRKLAAGEQPREERVEPRLNRTGRMISRVVMLITVAMLIWGGSAGFDTDLNHINYMTPQQKADLELISSGVDQGSMDQLSVLTSMLPSKSEQDAGRWLSFWNAHSDRIDQLRERSREYGFSEDAFAPFLNSVKTQPELISREDLMQESMADVMKTLVESLSDDFNKVLFMCGFVVFAFLWISFGKLELALISFLPLTVGWIWILSIMNMLGIQFNIVSIILATFIFGQGDDYTIFITEGLLHEYKTGVRTVDDRRRSVIISAVIMFIGIGTLIFAKHPAMRSLAEITILGMLVVVVMAHFLPEWLFQWMTMKNGRKREVPVSIMRILRSAWAFGFLLISVIVCTPVVLVIFIGRKREWKDRFLHNLLYRFANLVIRRVPAVGFTLDNSVGETFSKPAVIISNHQSHLDLMCLMMLTPKMVVVTNDWVWRNPIYGALIRRAEFVPAAEGIDDYMPQFRSLVERGYSILVFPEGTRSADCSILRFHKGAFHLAQELGLDILPVCLNGVGYALPKEEFMLRPGHITVTIGKRVAPDDLSWGADARERTKAFHKFYQEWYAQMCNKLES